MPGKTKQSDELTSLLTKLYTIQEEVGAKEKTTDEEKKKKAENAATMGKSRATKKTGSRFLELKSSIVDRLKTIQGLLEEQANRETMSVAQGNNPKETIAAQAEIREQIRQATDEWKEIDALYKNEARKKRSKFTKEELEVQETLVLRLQAEIEKVKDAQSRGYKRGDAATSLNLQALASIDATTLDGEEHAGSSGAFSPSVGGGGWASGPSGVEVTDGQRMQLQQLEDRDADFDRQLDEIGEGIQDLHEIAQIQGEEVRRQNAMLDNVGKKIDDVHEHVTTVNERMKETLDEVRGADKICVDIMCIVLALGFGAVFYNIAKNN
uniref:t-SNARE coiled-coil homology domain-containing protein n=1 Tax=Helicotheca tamesis TaxID=374047 RepID=A0A7S2H3E7_9STRA|mmetsp:Transcript_14947/g.20368  ORF Transcript_14947/g.20368 Transcript_14947/m.20368 type:complete len:324 (+) Transcript_14947:111-1082(+)|eukprot:CAMPEP_0185725204 /NCGR_PEP_ID=MMETSP1171-20130828/1504_1 /TAXON_ID=374046 /ORGANISM="Helicotheca tamensis, Strain CCMP826" /LENGTH=323 /DNA_ID=CAMNT_0028393265 /DNA_START=73 /DNA_END=1044 /DNA_ORIENTATION=+